MTSVAQDFLHFIDGIAERTPLPRVRTLLLPGPDVARSKDAEFCALELEDGSMGLSFVWLGNTLGEVRASALLPSLPGRDAREVAYWYAHEDVARRTLGFAAINAISQFFFARAGYVPEDASDSIGLVDPQPADHIGMIGLFTPLLEPILASGARLTVVELNPALAQDNGRYRVTLDHRELARCDKVVSTSTILLNGTLDNVLAACRNTRHFGVIGPTAGCLPDPLFARRVSTVGGTRIVDPAGFRAALAAGEAWGRHARKYCITRAAYPGFHALLSRL